MNKITSQPPPAPACPFTQDISLTRETDGSYTITGLHLSILIDIIFALRADAERRRAVGCFDEYCAYRIASLEGTAVHLDDCRRALFVEVAP